MVPPGSSSVGGATTTASTSRHSATNNNNELLLAEPSLHHLQDHHINSRQSNDNWLPGSDPPIMMQVMNNQDDSDGDNVYIDPKHEKRLIQRLDKRLLGFAMLGNMVKALDNSNLGSAFISGMEEELHITGLQYNWMSVIFMAGYLVMQIPSNMLLSRLRPSIYLPSLELIWCVLTLAMACVQSVNGVYVIRVLLGLAEAGFYPGIVFLIGTWYSKRELGKRMALLTICGALGTGSSGVIQAVMLTTMDGKLGISGWRWMFVFDACITAVLAWFGRQYLPDYPHNTSWLSNKERDIAIRRMGDDTSNKLHDSGLLVVPATGPHSKHESTSASVRKLLRNKYLYLFVLGWASLQLSLGAAHVLGIMAKKLGYDAVTANLLTTPDMLITMTAGLCNGFISDRMRTRFWCIVCPALLAFFGLGMLSSFVQPFGLLYASYICTHVGLGSITSIMMTWASETISRDIGVRALAIATMNTSASIMWLWSPLVLWPVTDAPRYHRGFTTSACCVVFFLMIVSIIGYNIHFKDRRSPIKPKNSSNNLRRQSSEIKEPLMSQRSYEED
ncbi:major facilitator superfamily domain-containing protein [Zychaea mexicana]|uniref:major facilitator superfamily domain-containing protein n=1 Tax=Zychaea mexicana TaxID=64656 RepID=UPI0022FE92F0|nr:major facilitator superfamily domain-containing protein [Zychaea mexicana]KAI9494711.1 major facilitator superfamily domain-containing protein [Zychaea mexicana]